MSIEKYLLNEVDEPVKVSKKARKEISEFKVDTNWPTLVGRKVTSATVRALGKGELDAMFAKHDTNMPALLNALDNLRVVHEKEYKHNYYLRNKEASYAATLESLRRRATDPVRLSRYNEYQCDRNQNVIREQTSTRRAKDFFPSTKVLGCKQATCTLDRRRLWFTDSLLPVRIFQDLTTEALHRSSLQRYRNNRRLWRQAVRTLQKRMDEDTEWNAADYSYDGYSEDEDEDSEDNEDDEDEEDAEDAHDTEDDEDEEVSEQQTNMTEDSNETIV